MRDRLKATCGEGADPSCGWPAREQAAPSTQHAGFLQEPLDSWVAGTGDDMTGLGNDTGQQLRILHVTNGSDAGGLSRYVYDLCAAMHEQGHEVAVAGQ